MDALTHQEKGKIPQKLLDIESEHRKLLDESIPENTKKAYRNDWNHFIQWCEDNNLNPLPADKKTVVLYLTDIKDQYKPTTIERRITSISKIHQYAGEETPTQNTEVRETLNAIKRVKESTVDKKDPLLTDHIIQICVTMGNRLIDKRDKSLILVGFASGMRRSGLVSLNVDDINITDKGLRVTIKKSKTDQEGKGRQIGIAHGKNKSTDPVSAYKQWLERSGIEEGAVFRSVGKDGKVKTKRLKGYSVSRIVKKHAKRIGMDPDSVSSHSLRSGLVTQSCMNELSIFSIMEQTGHKSQSVVREYYKPATIFQDNASSKLGL